MAKFNKGENQYGTIEQREIRFAKLFNERYPTHEYISGFTDVDSLIQTKCRICGHTQQRGAQCIRRNRPTKCRACSKAFLNHKKETAKTLADTIRENNRAKKTAKREAIKRVTNAAVCVQCGEHFIGTSRGMKFCSIKCLHKYHDKKKETIRRIRAKQAGHIDWTITLDKLIKRDHGVCHICGLMTNSTDYVIRDSGAFIAGDDYPSIDHVNALANGGTHQWDNVRLAHRRCNYSKGDNVLYADGNGQLKFCI